MITLREANTEDIGIIREIAGKTWFVTYQDILSDEQMDYMFNMMYSVESINRQMTEMGHTFYLALEGEVAWGYVSVEQHSDTLFHLHKLYVLPEAQGKGVGKILIHKAFDFAIEHARGKECILELNMNRNNKALSFYEKMGMHISDCGDFDIGNGYYMNDYIFRIVLP